MLRIHRDDLDAYEVNLILQGRIVAEWAELLESECEVLIRSGFHVVLDFSDVVFISRTGVEVVTRLEKAGVRITGCSSLIAAMLAQEGIVTRSTPGDAEYR